MAFTKVLGPGIHTLANVTSHNINSSGIITATKFVGDMEPGGGTGTFDSLTVTGNLGVGGTLTYMDVTNVDAVGIITAQEGIHFGIGATAGKFLASTGITTIASLKVSNLNSGRVTYTGSDGDLVDSSKLTFNGADLLIDAETNEYKGVKFDNSFNLTFGSSAGTSARLYLKGTSNGEDDAGDTFLGTGTGGEQWFQSNTFTAFKVDADGTIKEALRLLSGGQVAIGTATEGHADADELTIATTGRTGMTIRSGSSEYGNIFFSDATSGSGEHQGIFQYYHQDDAFIWKSGASATERLCIDSSGNLGIGLTNPTTNCNLHIKAATVTQIRLETTDNTSYGILRFVEGDHVGVKDKYIIGYNDDHSAQADQLSIKNQVGDITFMAGGVATTDEKVRIKSDGQVRIQTNGTNNVPAKLQLHSEDVSIVSGDHIGEIRFTGRDSAGAGTEKTGALIDVTAAADWNTGATGYYPSNIDFHTQSNTGTDTVAADSPRMRIAADGNIGIKIAEPKSNLHVYGPGDIRMGSLYGGVAMIALQVEYASGYTGTHFMFEITDQASYSFEGSHIVHGSGGSSYGTEVTVVRMLASREAGATDSGDTWRNGTVKYDNDSWGHDQVGLNPGAGTFSFTYDDTATTTMSRQKIAFSASGQSVGVWAKLNGIFTWGSASTNGRVQIKDKDGNVLWDSNP